MPAAGVFWTDNSPSPIPPRDPSTSCHGASVRTWWGTNEVWQEAGGEASEGVGKELRVPSVLCPLTLPAGPLISKAASMFHPPSPT